MIVVKDVRLEFDVYQQTDDDEGFYEEFIGTEKCGTNQESLQLFEYELLQLLDKYKNKIFL